MFPPLSAGEHTGVNGGSPVEDCGLDGKASPDGVRDSTTDCARQEKHLIPGKRGALREQAVWAARERRIRALTTATRYLYQA